MYEILYIEEVVKEDLPAILEPSKSEIKRAIDTKLMRRPEVYSRPLRRSLRGYRKLRIGNYRIIFRVDENRIKIFVIHHRSIVYVDASKRL